MGFLKKHIDKFMESMSDIMQSYEKEKRIPFQTVWCPNSQLTFRIPKN